MKYTVFEVFLRTSLLVVFKVPPRTLHSLSSHFIVKMNSVTIGGTFFIVFWNKVENKQHPFSWYGDHQCVIRNMGHIFQKLSGVGRKRTDDKAKCWSSRCYLRFSRNSAFLLFVGRNEILCR